MIYQLTLTAIGHLKFKGQERFVSFIVSAPSDNDARKIACKKDLMGGEEIWLDSCLSACVELDLNKEVISATFLSKSNI
jgi:hypothetical protein